MPPQSFLAALSVAMMIAALPMPYGYYQLLRLVAFGVLAWQAVVFLRALKKEALAGACGVLALLYNPFVKVHFERDTWAIINIATAVFIAFIIRLRQKDAI
ncbi:DUF6804 family protein [Blastomonas sp.]|uniref:DUF6804 family protein n=1 Tax=Blastomonas sp. TaxID=1909299 RepID=UPI00391AD421